MANPGSSDSLATAALKTQAHELVKQFNVYDGSGRLTTVYTARFGAETGTPCSRVDYTYLNPTSGLVEKMRESNDVWNSSYDI
jgi:hypothetical protein